MSFISTHSDINLHETFKIQCFDLIQVKMENDLFLREYITWFKTDHFYYCFHDSYSVHQRGKSLYTLCHSLTSRRITVLLTRYLNVINSIALYQLPI